MFIKENFLNCVLDVYKVIGGRFFKILISLGLTIRALGFVSSFVSSFVCSLAPELLFMFTMETRTILFHLRLMTVLVIIFALNYVSIHCLFLPFLYSTPLSSREMSS